VQDELSMKAVLDGFVPFSGSDKAAEVIARWTKYERLEGTFPANLGEGLSLVAIARPADGAIAVVMRTLEEVVPLKDQNGQPNGKTWNRYSIDALHPCSDADQAEDLLQRARAAYEFQVSRQVDGFGQAPVERPESGEVEANGAW